MAEFSRKPRKFNFRGINLNLPVDMLGNEWAARMENVSMRQDGSIQGRAGTNELYEAAAGATGHSLMRLNQKVNASLQAYTYVMGAGTKLYTDNAAHAAALVERDTGYSGNPIYILGVRPRQSPEPWAYVLDALTKKRKVRVDGTVQKWGIAPPTAPPKIADGIPNYKVISDFDATTESAVAWTQTGTAAAPTAPDRVASTTLSQILYDRDPTTSTLNTSGWCLMALATPPTTVGKGMFLTTGVTTAEKFRVEDVFPQVASTTISSIKYETGSTGYAIIQSVIPIVGIRRNMLLRLAATENIRVLSVTTGVDGIQSFRAYLSTTRAAGDAIDGFKSIRAYVVNTHNNTTTTVTTKNLATSVTTGTGNLSHAVARDLSNTGTRPIQPTDAIHCSIAASSYNAVDEVRVMFDLDDGTFTKNYLYYAISGNDLLAGISQTQTPLQVQQTTISRTLIEGAQRRLTNIRLRERDRTYMEDRGWFEDPFEPIEENPLLWDYYFPGTPLPTTPTQTGTGDAQYTEVIFPVSALQRVGQDESKSLRDVISVRISIKCNANVDIKVDAAWIGGTYLLNTETVQDASPYLYAYAYLNSLTGEMSNFSPPIREGIRTLNNYLDIYATSSADSQVDKYVWARWGGTLNVWSYLGTQDAADAKFSDTFSDMALFGATTFPDPWSEQFQPIPFPDTPRTGTCDVKGTEVTRVGGTDSFNTSWARNATIVIDGKPCTLYTSPSSTTQLSINENLGTLTGVKFYLAQPLLMNQEADAVFGPYGSGFTGLYLFFIRSNYLIWTNGDDPSAIKDGNMLEVTGGSEVLMGGCIYDGRPYLLSNETIYEVSSPLLGATRFKATPIAHTKGLFGKHALKVTPYGIVYLADDGIYLSAGGQSASLTKETLQPLFPNNGIAGVATSGWNPPDMTRPNEMFFEFANNQLYFDYIDTGGARRTLVYDFATQHRAWISRNTYSPAITRHYSDKAESVTTLYAVGRDTTVLNAAIHQEFMSTSQDNGIGITPLIQTGADDAGDPEMMKVFGDYRVDVNCGHASTPIIITPAFDNFATALTSALPVGVTRAMQVLDLNAGAGQAARNMGLTLTWSTGTNSTCVVYGWGFSAVPKPEKSAMRFSDWDDAGSKGAKQFRGFVLEADTFNVARNLIFQFDDGTTTSAIAITHNGQLSKEYAFVTPVLAHKVKLKLQSDANQWQLYDVRYIVDDKPENAKLWTDWTNCDYDGDKLIKGVWIEMDTNNVATTVSIYKNGATVANSETLSATHNGQRGKYYALATPFLASTVRLSPAQNWRLIKVKWDYDPRPPSGTIIPDWTDAGRMGAKFFQGCIIELDTEGQSVNFSVYADGDQATIKHTELGISTSGLTQVAFSFDPPFIAHTIKVVPSAALREWRVEYRWEPEPELVLCWQTQATSHDQDGWMHLKEAEIALISNSEVTLSITVDDATPVTYFIDSTIGKLLRSNVMFAPLKGKQFSYRLSSTEEFRLYLKDSHVKVMPWGSQGDYLVARPFGDLHRESGARI